MKQSDDNDHGDSELYQQYQLDAPPAKVWRAISVPALRAHWLPDGDLADAQAIETVPGQEICYGMRERQPPFLESQVRLQISPAPDGGTILTIIHAVGRAALAANDSSSVLMLAA